MKSLSFIIGTAKRNYTSKLASLINGVFRFMSCGLSPRFLTIISSLTILLSTKGFPQVFNPQNGTAYYVIHSSGNVLNKNSQDGGQITGYKPETDQQLQFIADGDGYYSLKLSGQNSYLTISGSWNTIFAANPDVDEAKFSIVPVSSTYLTLKNKANGKFLGTDNSTSGSSVFSDKNGTDSKHYWVVSEEHLQPGLVTEEYSITPRAIYDKPFEGWGVSLCWWANMCGKWDDSKIDEIVDWLVSPDGLNYNIFRYNIGGGDDPLNRNCDLHHMANGKGIRAEMEGFKDGTNSPYDWTRDAAQRKIMLKIKEKRPDAIFEAFSNSAPYYMTYSGCSAGNVNAGDDNLRPEYYTEFAQYLVDVCKHYKDEYGIEFKTLDPFNEPVTNYWRANGGQEGCHFSTSAQIDFIKILSPILQQSGLSTVISSADETSVAQQVADVNAYISSDVFRLIGQINTHTYTADNLSRANLRSLASNLNMPLWMSEVGAGGTGIRGNLSLAQKLIDDIRFLRPEAWVDWQYIEEGNDQWCLVQGNFANQSYFRVKNYYIRQQVSRYIHKDYHFVFAPNRSVLAAVNPPLDTMVVTLLNTSSSPVRHRIDLSAFATVGTDIAMVRTSEQENVATASDFSLEEKTLSVLCPGLSITTLVVPIDEVAPKSDLAIGIPYHIMSRSSDCGLQPGADGTTIQQYRYADSSQMWVFDSVGVDEYRITNLRGEVLTDDGSYFLQTTTADAAGQEFSVVPVGDGCSRISSATSGKSFDLQGESNSAGTNVGLYDYGSGPAHRQWLLYPLYSSNAAEPAVQSIRLQKGWNLISVAVEADTMAISSIFPNAKTVKHISGFYKSDNPAFLNGFANILPGAGYAIDNVVEETIVLRGQAIDSSWSLSALPSGWNLIGCPNTDTVSVSDALGDDSDTIMQIKDFQSFWLPNYDQNSLETIELGKAYYLLKK